MMMIVLKRKIKLYLISFGIFILCSVLKVTNLSPSSFPLTIFSNLSIAQFHSFIVKACSFLKACNSKGRLSLHSFNNEIKPCIAPS